MQKINAEQAKKIYELESIIENLKAQINKLTQDVHKLEHEVHRLQGIVSQVVLLLSPDFTDRSPMEHYIVLHGSPMK